MSTASIKNFFMFELNEGKNGQFLVYVLTDFSLRLSFDIQFYVLSFCS